MRVKLIACERVINLTGLLSGGVSRGIKMALTEQLCVLTSLTVLLNIHAFILGKKRQWGGHHVNN